MAPWIIGDDIPLEIRTVRAIGAFRLYLFAKKAKVTRMTNLKFSQALTILGEQMGRDGFRLAVGGIFLKAKTKVTSFWISIAGNEHVFSSVIGVSNRDVDRLVNRALRATIPTFKASKSGVPLFRLTPERLSPGDVRLLKPITEEGGYLPHEINSFAEFLRDSCYPFLDEHCTLPSALDLALRWNKFDQAQIYYIPAMMLRLGLDKEERAYVNEVATSLPRQTGGSEMYRAFIERLERYRDEI